MKDRVSSLKSFSKPTFQSGWFILLLLLSMSTANAQKTPKKPNILYGGACSYFAPVRKFAITPNMVFTYDVYLTIDEVKNIRNAFFKIKK